MKKMWAAAAAEGAVAVLISGCALNTGARVYDNEKALSGNANSYNLVNYSGSMSDNTVSGSAEKLEGMDTIWEFNTDEPTEVNISCNLTVTPGKAKLVYIDPDGTVTTIAECIAGEENEQSVSESIKAEEGENRITACRSRGHVTGV